MSDFRSIADRMKALNRPPLVMRPGWPVCTTCGLAVPPGGMRGRLCEVCAAKRAVEEAEKALANADAQLAKRQRGVEHARAVQRGRIKREQAKAAQWEASRRAAAGE